MKRIFHCGWPVWSLLLLAGCAADFRTPPARLDLAALFPVSEQRVPVIFPEERERQGADGDSLVEAYGPAWRDLHDHYPEYQFN